MMQRVHATGSTAQSPDRPARIAGSTFIESGCIRFGYVGSAAVILSLCLSCDRMRVAVAGRAWQPPESAATRLHWPLIRSDSA